MRTRKKLIEVALPLDAVNKASAREKSIRHGHPSTLHLWWARRPLATAAGGDLRADGRRPVRVRRRAAVGPEDAAGRQAAAPAASGGVREPTCRGGWRGGRGLGADAGGGGGGAGARAPVQAHRRPRAVGEHHQRRGAGAGADRDLAELAAYLRRKTRATRAPGSCSTATSCRRSTTRSPAAAPCRSRRSASASKPMPATSTRWRCSSTRR